LGRCSPSVSLSLLTTRPTRSRSWRNYSRCTLQMAASLFYPLSLRTTPISRKKRAFRSFKNLKISLSGTLLWGSRWGGVRC
jgi:hypothetical protein